MPRVKVCGLTRKQDVRGAVELGVDALGFILAPSPRQISLKQVRELTTGLPPFVTRVGVVVEPPADRLREIEESRLFDYLQFHGREDPALFGELTLPVIKAIGIKDEQDLQQIEKYRDCDFLLFDTRSQDRQGGTGQAFNWELLTVLDLEKPYILAGGLGPENIEQALKVLNPAAVDLNSRLEQAPGHKDLKLLELTMNKMSGVDSNE